MFVFVRFATGFGVRARKQRGRKQQRELGGEKAKKETKNRSHPA
jgi:hypothetical protein